MTFSLDQKKNYHFPTFEQPKVIGYFSLNGKDRVYNQDSSQLKYLYKPAISKSGFDLNQGISTVIRKQSHLNERIDFILKWIINNFEKFRAHSKLPEIICYRGLLSRISCTPYENRDGWIIYAAKFHGIIYLCAAETEQDRQRIDSMTTNDLKFMSWGYKFEQYMTSDVVNVHPDTSKPVNECEEFCCLFTSKLDGTTILYGAEMDGIDSTQTFNSSDNLNKLKFIELKTSKMPMNHYGSINFKKKTMKWWIQSFLVGIDSIICGFRNDNGKIISISSIKVPDLAKKSENLWNASICMNFCNRFLKHIKNVVVKDYEDAIYKFEFVPGKDIEMEELSNISTFEFLPEWYTETLKELTKMKHS